MKKKKYLVFGAILLLLTAVLFAMLNGLSDGKNVVLNGVDLSRISDGDYTGTYEHGRWTNTLTVHVENKKIVRIDINKDVFAAWVTHCSEEVFRRVTGAQNTQVDAVSGATVTTKAYLKAIENALAK